jgi:multidrug efflux pump subunit AcrA (membrane-fusion protein)
MNDIVHRWLCPRRALLTVLLVLAVLAGCHKVAPQGNPIDVEPRVNLVKPERRELSRQIGQPGYVFAYEQTSMYPKVAGYIEQWMVDIGDTIKRGQILSTLYVPELHARHKEKKADVALDQVRVRLAERSVDVAQEEWQVALADIDKYKADVQRWQSEVPRLASAKVEGRLVVNEQVLAESQRQLDIARASLAASQAREKARSIELAKTKIDVEAARAQVAVDQAAEEHLAALVSYTKMTAPYDGIVVVRNANTGDYVEPRYGDASAPIGGVRSENPERGTPVYVVARIDVVRVYVDVPEVEAAYVAHGTKARVRIQSLNDEEIQGTVSRTSKALNVQSRTLRAEIDLPNKDGRIRPGMYAFGWVEIARRGVRSLPIDAVIEIGNQNSIYLHENGKAVRTPVQIGISDGKYLEVFRKKVKGKWQEFTGDEEVILGDLPDLRDGETVRVIQAKGT